MKIHTLEIRNVRQIHELALDLSAPLTVIAGPNGVGKTTVQQAILAAMFLASKETRDSFVSRFDPHSSPTAVLGLSHGGPEATIWLTRVLTDDKGEWKEGATVLKRKKQALEKVQETLPIGADAAALLLWGRQDDLPAVVEKFPADGHSLLTAATIKGAGPDPKKIIKELERDLEDARKGERGGQVVGALTQATTRFEELEEELNSAKTADEKLRQCRDQWERARSQRDQIKSQCAAEESQICHQANLEQLLATALDDSSMLSDFVKTQDDWAGLEDEIDQARKDLADLEKELQRLHVQYRVARDQELGRQIEFLRAKIQAVHKLESRCGDLEKDLESKKRPDASELKKLNNFRGAIKEAETKMDASGVRYELSIASGSRALRISEDGNPEKDITLEAGQVHQGIVGRLVIEVDGLRMAAAGKEDISRHKRVVADNAREIEALFQKYGADNEVAFINLAAERDELHKILEKSKNDMQVQLGQSTRHALETDLARLEQARLDNSMTLADKEGCAGKVLPPAAEIDNWRAQKQGEIRQAKESLAVLEEKRPSKADQDLLKINLEGIRKKFRESAAAFKDADESHREPGRDLQNTIKKSLDKRRQAQAKLARDLNQAEATVADLAGQLKQIQPRRSVEEIQSDLEEAKENLNREQVLQEARGLLQERIEEKIDALAAHVPIELGKNITHHLSQLTAGCFGPVILNPELAVDRVGENGQHPEHWQPHELSHGQRHQTALAVKIAVARALAESNGPVFIMLDDSLVTFDPERRAATEDALLELVADGRIQVILLTCHSDWAAHWKNRRPDNVTYIYLPKEIRYYREPPALAAASVSSPSVTTG